MKLTGPLAVGRAGQRPPVGFPAPSCIQVHQLPVKCNQRLSFFSYEHLIYSFGFHEDPVTKAVTCSLLGMSLARSVVFHRETEKKALQVL